MDPAILDKSIARHWGRRIADQLAFLGMSGADLARAIPVHETSVSKWLAGDRTPRPAHQVLIADALHTTPGMLFTWPEFRWTR